MVHHTPLIATLVAGLVLAFLLGTAANRLRVSPIAGYLLAGVLVGPFTPGFVANQALALELAEIGVILLMFGVGLHFSVQDLLSVKAIAIPGALIQIAASTLLGMGLAWMMGWPAGAGFVFGLALSVASTVVLLRSLQEHHLLETERGRIAIGWLVVQDLAMVLALVLLPALAGLVGAKGGPATDHAASAVAPDLPTILTTAAITLGKVAAFVALMLVFGRRVIPWILHYVAHTGSRELFRLAVLAIALGVAYGAAALFGVSFALGAFFAGMVLSESPLSQRATEESLPLRDAFAVLFFVSVGMLFDPHIFARSLGPVLGAVLLVMVGNAGLAFLILRAFGRPLGAALTIAAGLAQIGEFSFILAALGIDLGLLPPEGRSLILATAILAILANPLVFVALDRLRPRLDQRLMAETAPVEIPEPEGETDLIPTALTDHAVVIGYGRVGQIVAEGLLAQGRPVLVVEERRELIEPLRARGVEVLFGNAAQAEILQAANLLRARRLFIAIPNNFEAGQIVQQARALNPALDIVARAHSDAEIDYLAHHGANLIVMGEREIALAMLNHAVGPLRPESEALDCGEGPKAWGEAAESPAL